MPFARRFRPLLILPLLAGAAACGAVEVVELGIEPLQAAPAASAPAAPQPAPPMTVKSADDGYLPAAATLVLAALGSALFMSARRPPAG